MMDGKTEPRRTPMNALALFVEEMQTELEIRAADLNDAIEGQSRCERMYHEAKVSYDSARLALNALQADQPMSAEDGDRLEKVKAMFAEIDAKINASLNRKFPDAIVR